MEEEATLYSHPKYPPEDTFIISFSKRIVQKLDLTLYTVEELSLRFNFTIFPFPQPPTPQAESRVKSTEHLNMLQEQNETERLDFISWRFFCDRSPMRNICLAVSTEQFFYKNKKMGYTLIHIYYQHSIYSAHA